jgi:hypothetical protein
MTGEENQWFFSSSWFLYRGSPAGLLAFSSITGSRCDEFVNIAAKVHTKTMYVNNGFPVFFLLGGFKLQMQL